MVTKFVRSPYVRVSTGDVGGMMPYLPLNLSNQGRVVNILGLVDSGASVNVLPFSVGIRLGASWDAQTVPLELGGNLAQTEARGLLVTAVIASFASVRLAFAWARSDDVPVILGQTNFFDLFEVCFLRQQSLFKLRQR